MVVGVKSIASWQRTTAIATSTSDLTQPHLLPYARLNLYRCLDVEFDFRCTHPVSWLHRSDARHRRSFSLEVLVPTLSVPNLPWPRRLIDILGHLGLWPGLYATAATCCYLELIGLRRPSEPWASGVIAVGFTATGIYLLDRVKFRREWIDPADCFALPGRYQFLCEHQGLCRFIAIALLGGGAFLGERVSVWAPVAVGTGALSALIYAAAPKGHFPRIKDLPFLKNLYTAGGLVGFVAAAGCAINGRLIAPAWHLQAALAGIALLLARVFLDAALCDVYDEEADRIYGTTTSATRFGSARARRWATTANVLIPIALMMVRAIPFAARAGWATVWLGSSVVLPAISTERLADFVDVRFAVEAILATAAMRWF